MKLPKWLLLQMTQMRTTCSKKEKKVILPSFFCIIIPRKNRLF